MKTISFNIPWHIILHFHSLWTLITTLYFHIRETAADQSPCASSLSLARAAHEKRDSWRYMMLDQYSEDYTFVPQQQFIIWIYITIRVWRPVAHLLRIIPLHHIAVFKIQTLLLITYILYLALTTICTFLYNGLLTTTFSFTIIRGLYYHRLTHFYIFLLHIYTLFIGF